MQSTHPGQTEGARIDIVVELRGRTYYIDTAIVTPLSSNAGLMSAARGRPGYMAKREEKINSTDTPASIWPHSFSSLQGDRDTMPESSSNTSTTTRTTHQRPFGTPGQQSKPPYTTAYPNNNSGRSPRDCHNHCLTHVTPLGHPLSSAHLRPEPLSNYHIRSPNLHVPSSCHRLLSGQYHFSRPRSVPVFRHDGSVTATG